MNQPCLVCFQPFAVPFSWRKFLGGSVFSRQLLQSPEEGICSSCLEEIEFLPEKNTCQRCSRDLQLLAREYHYEYGEGKLCYDCWRWLALEEELNLGCILSKNRSAFVYNEWAQDLLHNYKFRGDTRLAYFLASTIAYTCLPLAVEQAFDLVVPIPLTPSRLQERGFNQAGLIAQLVASYRRWPYTDDLLLSQTSIEEKQSKKDRSERLADLLHKFVKNPNSTVDIYGKKILVVDDIYTTGATLYAAAYILKQAGAGSVYSLTAAR